MASLSRCPGLVHDRNDRSQSRGATNFMRSDLHVSTSRIASRCVRACLHPHVPNQTQRRCITNPIGIPLAELIATARRKRAPKSLADSFGRRVPAGVVGTPASSVPSHRTCPSLLPSCRPPAAVAPHHGPCVRAWWAKLVKPVPRKQRYGTTGEA